MGEIAIAKQTKENKKATKIKKKQEKQELIDKHTKICSEILEKGYDVLLNDIEKFNLELVSMSQEISDKTQELEKYISLDDVEKAKENIRTTFELSSVFFKRIMTYITPGGKESITRPLHEASSKLNKYLNNLELTLSIVKNKNAVFITSAVFNILQRKSDDYCRLVCDDFYSNNEYFKAFEDTYYNYETVVKMYRRELIKQKRLEEELDIEKLDIQKETCGKGRLRVTHADMINFAKAMGFEEDRQGNSTHRVFRHPETGVSVPIPAKKGRDMPQGTMSNLLKQMGYKRIDLAKFLSK